MVAFIGEYSAEGEGGPDVRWSVLVQTTGRTRAVGVRVRNCSARACRCVYPLQRLIPGVYTPARVEPDAVLPPQALRWLEDRSGSQVCTKAASS